MKLVFNVFTGNLDYVASTPGDVGIVFPLAPNLGGTGIANAVGSTLTLGGATTVPAPGGTVALLATQNVFTTTQQITVPTTTLKGLVLKTSDNNTTKNLLEFNSSTDANLIAVNPLGYLYRGANVFLHWTGTNNLFVGVSAGNVTTSGTGQNTALGQGALGAITTGYYNMAIGGLALSSLTEGNSNVAVGIQALKSVTTGFGNFGLGYFALNLCTGNYNVAIGNEAGRRISSGASNILIGASAGAFITTNSSNVMIGDSAGYSATGKRSVLIGHNAGLSLTSGESQIFIGYAAGYQQTTISNLLIIDNTFRASAAAEAQNAFLYGSMAAGGFLQLNIPTTTNNAILSAFKLQAYVSTAAAGSANGFGVGLPFYAETATDGTYQQQGLVSTYWVDATNATRKATLVLSAYDTAERKGIEIRANGSTPDIVLLGDTWWEGEGFGLPYGSCSSNDTDINWTQAAAVQNTWYDISDADMVDGQLNLVTHDGSGQLTVTKGGRYLINYGLVAEANAANTHLETAISVSGTESGFGISHAEAVTPNTERNFNGTAILDLAANATINLSIRTTDAGGPNLKVEMMDITLVMVGGT